ncbi:hypothetical protein QBC32DRAFT_367535 [Pseudoneurospora amorphoporcata]|uniref:Uncharacterized protein n=1 Tax=Pseudoneurospora amorphoporcata TaxID=241081 RepID=A0AAN6SJU7_9PEZI|nr:hypothetical protein QBC32DRAFT_367535 [Pseudoneurospora amorphoporcata]
MLSLRCPLISTHAFHTSDEEGLLGHNSPPAFCRGIFSDDRDVPPPPYTAEEQPGQPQMPQQVYVPARVYRPDRDTLFLHVQLGHMEVSRQRFETEVRVMQYYWGSMISPRQYLGGIYPEYVRDFREFFVDCYMWNKYIHIDESARTAELTKLRLVKAEAEVQHLRSKYEKLNKETQELKQALAERNAIAAAYNDVIKGLKQEVEQAEVAREVTEQTMASKVAGLEAELRQAKKESAAQLEEERVHLQALASELKKFQYDNAEQNVKLSNKITKLEEQNDSLEEQLQKQHELLNKKVKEQGQVTARTLKFASIDDTLAKVEAQTQSTRVHNVKIKEKKEGIQDKSKAKAAADNTSGSMSDKMTCTELELECSRLRDLVARRNSETGHLHVRAQNLARRTREAEEKERELEAKEEGVKKDIAVVLTKAGHVKRVGKVVCLLVKKSPVPALCDSLAGMLENLEKAVKKLEDDMGPGVVDTNGGPTLFLASSNVNINRKVLDGRQSYVKSQ